MKSEAFVLPFVLDWLVFADSLVVDFVKEVRDRKKGLLFSALPLSVCEERMLDNTWVWVFFVD